MKIMVTAGMFCNIGFTSFNTENAIPVDIAAKDPHAIPNPGINIGRASNVLCTNIPKASISSITVSNSSNIIADSSSET